MKTLLETPNSPWKKLLPIYQKLEISEEFINCADLQLTPIFENLTGIKVVDKIRLAWDEEPVEYEKDLTSRLSAKLWLKYGFNKVNIVWNSISGQIYELDDLKIDCDDIKFWFEGLNPELCMHYWKPKWSLITFKDIYIASFLKNHNLQLSASFVQCMDMQLSLNFTKLTGVNIDKEINLSWETEDFFYTKSELSSFASKLYVHHNWNPINIVWKSKSGRIYEFFDEDIDNNDIIFQFENLDILLIQDQVYKKGTLPFNVKNLTYELNVSKFGINCHIEMSGKAEDNLSIKRCTMSINEFIVNYNDTSEKLESDNGVIHNWNHDFEDKVLIYEIDLGSTGADFMRKLLNFLSEMNCFLKVTIS